MEERHLMENMQEPQSDKSLNSSSASMDLLEDPSTQTNGVANSTFSPQKEVVLESLDSDSDPELRLFEIEPELWANTVDKEFVSQLTSKQVKRQEHIYELIITEKRHCRILKIMRELFAKGMRQELGMKEAQIASIFPCLDDLITIHFSFLWRLRELQRADKYIANIGNLLLEEFAGDSSHGLKSAYGTFCSKHQEAVMKYQKLVETDRGFQMFIRSTLSHEFLKKQGVPECLLSVSTRITKYPLMIGAIMKYTKDQEDEAELLKKALQCSKNVLVNINHQVAEKERRKRLLDIYDKLDSKSSTIYKNNKFKKFDLLMDGRKLMFEGEAVLSLHRGKQLMVTVIVMSDLIFFLEEYHQKYYFVSPESETGTIPLGKLLVREKAGQDTRSIYLISENQNEMFEIECVHPKEKKTWLDSIREAVEKYSDSDNEFGSGVKQLREVDTERVHQILERIQQKDMEVAKVCEEKMEIVNELIDALGGDVPSFAPPDYRSLLAENNLDHVSAKELQLASLHEALRLVGSSNGWGTNLSRTPSSVGEHQSETYVSPNLPKRAGTFGGFDNPIKDNSSPLTKQSEGKKKKKKDKASLLPMELSSSSKVKDSRKQKRVSEPWSSENDFGGVESNDNTDSESESPQQQETTTANIYHNLNTALVLSQHQWSQYEMLRAKVMTGSSIDSNFSHSQKLEELRNLQEQISHERAQWTKERENQDKWISDKRNELKKLQETLNKQQEDIIEQREDLYRKLEALNSQGIVLNPSLTVLTSPNSGYLNAHDSSSSGSENSTPSQNFSPNAGLLNRITVPHEGKLRSPKVPKRWESNSMLRPSVTQQKESADVKQQLPMKLSSLATMGSSTSRSSLPRSGSKVSQDCTPHKPPRSHSLGPQASPPSIVKQVLPMKLSKGLSEAKNCNGRLGNSYRRFASPIQSSSDGSFVHQRPGSSPNLQNGVQPLVTVPSSIAGHTGQPCQQIKDPDTNQNIIFF